MNCNKSLLRMTQMNLIIDNNYIKKLWKKNNCSKIHLTIIKLSSQLDN